MESACGTPQPSKTNNAVLDIVLNKFFRPGLFSSICRLLFFVLKSSSFHSYWPSIFCMKSLFFQIFIVSHNVKHIYSLNWSYSFYCNFILWTGPILFIVILFSQNYSIWYSIPFGLFCFNTVFFSLFPLYLGFIIPFLQYYSFLLKAMEAKFQVTLLAEDNPRFTTVPLNHCSSS